MRNVEHTTYGVLTVMALLAAPFPGWGQSPWGQGGVPAALEACEAELQACLELPCGIFPGDGQTGVPLAYEEADPSDGTFTDLNTGLMWEIKDGDDGIADYDNPHDVDNRYTWSYLGGDDPDGTAFIDFLATLNGQAFAGHDDWRLPTIKELQSLVDYSVSYPGPTVAEGLPGATAPADYWSYTSVPDLFYLAWYVRFSDAHISGNAKYFDGHVRTVRGGW